MYVQVLYIQCVYCLAIDSVYIMNYSLLVIQCVCILYMICSAVQSSSMNLDSWPLKVLTVQEFRLSRQSGSSQFSTVDAI